MTRICLLLAASLVFFGAYCSARAESEHAAEARLLHRRLDLTGLEAYTHQAWSPMKVPAGKVLLVNLWSTSCEPCKRELPLFASFQETWRARPEVAFLFIADPPSATSREDVARFWEHPAPLLIPAQQACPGQGAPVLKFSAPHPCGLALPKVDPARSRDQRLRMPLGTDVVPITLLIDPHGIVRQAFVGSMERRMDEVGDGLTRLLMALHAEGKGGQLADLRKH